jgi:uncharacterized protein (TIGR02597 family)
MPDYRALAGLFLTVLVIPAISATTETVGCYPIALPSGTDSRIGIPLERNPVFRGRVESVAGTTLTVEGEPGWESGSLAGGRGEYFYCQVRDGELAGMTLPILANDERSITVSLEGEDPAVLGAALSGAGISVVPCWTPESLFAQSQPADKTILFVYCIESPGVNKVPAAVLTYFAGYGWYDGSFAPADTHPLQPHAGLVVRVPERAEPVMLNVVGRVPTTETRRVVSGYAESIGTDTLVTLPFPEAISLGAAGLNLQDRVNLFVYENPQGFNPVPSKVLTYYVGFGWYDQVFKPADAFELKPGVAYVLRLPRLTVYTEWLWSHRPGYLDSLLN